MVKRIPQTWTRHLFLALAMVSVGAHGARAQQTGSRLGDPAADLRYANQTAPKNALFWDVQGATTYDDNVFNDNRHRVQDLVFEGGARISYQQERRLRFKLVYHPDILLYRSVSAYNQLNHAFETSAQYQVSQHFLLGASDLLEYRTGFSPARQNEDLSPQAGPLPGLNRTTFLPLVRELANEAQVWTDFLPGRRTSIGLTAGLENRRFSGGGGLASFLFGLRSTDVGFRQTYRFTRTVYLGTQYFFQSFRFGQGSRAEVHTVLMSLRWGIGPHLTLQLFGGSQHSWARDQFPSSALFLGQPAQISLAVSSAQWRPEIGGSLDMRSNRTIFRLSGQRLVTDGGGLLTTVDNAVLAAELRRRISRGWDLLLDANLARSKALSPLLGGRAVTSSGAGMSLEHQVTERLTLRCSYGYIRQHGDSALPFLTNLDRSRVTLSLTYRAASVVSGR